MHTTFLKTPLLLLALAAASGRALEISTPLFPHKDGEADATGSQGSREDLEVDGGSSRVVAWIAYHGTSPLADAGSAGSRNAE